MPFDEEDDSVNLNLSYDQLGFDESQIVPAEERVKSLEALRWEKIRQERTITNYSPTPDYRRWIRTSVTSEFMPEGFIPPLSEIWPELEVHEIRKLRKNGALPPAADVQPITGSGSAPKRPRRK